MTRWATRPAVCLRQNFVSLRRRKCDLPQRSVPASLSEQVGLFGVCAGAPMCFFVWCVCVVTVARCARGCVSPHSRCATHGPSWPFQPTCRISCTLICQVWKRKLSLFAVLQSLSGSMMPAWRLPVEVIPVAGGAGQAATGRLALLGSGPVDWSVPAQVLWCWVC